MKALVIEDEADICYLLNGILKQNNIQASFVGTLLQAEKALAEAKPPPLIFLDNHLPDGTGISYISKFKKEYPDSKIIMITAYDNESDRENAISEGVDYFIGKPFSRDSVTAAIKAVAR